jgi:hypothetical protein
VTRGSSLRQSWSTLIAVVVAMAAGFIAGAVPASAAPGRLWLSRYNGPGGSFDHVRDLAASPDGSSVFVTGTSVGSGTSNDYGTVAYDTNTGSQRWVARYDDSVSGIDDALALAVSLDGGMVFVTGRSDGPNFFWDYATVAYDADTGTQLWVARYRGAAGFDDTAYAIDVSPDGSKVFVTGASEESGTTVLDFTTVAYDAISGTQLWVFTYNDAGNGEDQGNAIQVSTDGATVFATGWGHTLNDGDEYVTIAFDAETGVERWLSGYNGPTDFGSDRALALSLAPDGSAVYVTGNSADPARVSAYATVAYDASLGTQLWSARYNGPVNGYDIPKTMTTSPDGSMVVVTGVSIGNQEDYATVAYDAATGHQFWAARYDGPASTNDGAQDLVVTPEGARVYVVGYSTGSSGTIDYATVAYGARTGAQRAVARFGTQWPDAGYAVGLDPGGSTLIVSGDVGTPNGWSDYGTIAYNLSP